MALGGTKRAVARAFGLNESSVWRHWTYHTSQAVKDAQRISILKPGATLESMIEEEGTDHLETLKLARASLLWSLDQALQVERHRDVALLTAQLIKLEQLIGQFTGKFVSRSEHVSMNLHVSEDWLKTRAIIFRALVPFQQARQAVATALYQHEREQARPTTIEAAPAISRADGHADAQ